MRCRRCGRCTGKAAAVNEFCDDETPARILYTLNSLYISKSLLNSYISLKYMRVYIYTPSRLLSSSSVFLLLLHK
jgi:hypothetical protein